MSPKQSAPAPKKSPTNKAARKTAAKKQAAGKAPRVKRTVLQAAKAARLLQEKEARQIAKAQAAEEREAKKKADRDQKIRERETARAAREAKRLRDKEEKAKARKLEREQKVKPPRMPRPGLPIIKKDMELDEAMMRKDWSERPLTGRDLATLVNRIRISHSEFASAMGLQNRFAFMKLLKTAKVLPFDVEMLARLYDMSPAPAPWVSHSADQVFQTLYGGALARFKRDAEEAAYARTLFYARFTGALDRSSSTAYRWVEEEGNARLPISLFLRKLMSMPKPLQALEDLARLVHKNRGGDFERRAPYPERDGHQGRRGRAAKVDRVAHKVRGASLPIQIQPVLL